MTVSPFGSEAVDNNDAFEATGQRIWNGVRDVLRDKIAESEYDRWIEDLRLVADLNGEMIVAARDPLAFDRVTSQYLRLIEKLWAAADPAERAFKLICWRNAPADLRDLVDDPWAVEAPAAPAEPEAPATSSGAGPAMTFDTLVTGPSNEIAVTLAKRIAAGLPAGTATTLIYGPPGTGKTHLMQALRQETARRDTGRRIVYLTAEEFMSAYLDGVKARDTGDLKKRLRAASILLIDDLHRIAGKPGTEAELYQNIREVTSNGGQVVLVGDSAPGEANGFGQRMRSEIKGATAVEVALPDADMRREILERLAGHIAENHPAFVLTDEMMQRLNNGIRGPGRELTGAVWSLYTEAGFGERAPTMEMLEKIIRRHAGEQREPSIEVIKRATLKVFPIAKSDLEGPSKMRGFVYPRQIAMYLCRTLTRKSFPQIGRAFGKRDHTTVLYAFRRMEGELGKDQELASDIAKVQAVIHELMESGQN
ncbi:chromosomal replication initiator protein DnaA [Hyphomonas sp.]|uniref:chromosomal replication initiator protein DnaA n=1 Tax=Hyphomonas sp. TaxID=87 RepID=UPI0025C510DB|nr:chromosomal replication initiator protein DnaA [Hyphomonas sp.]